MGRAVLLAQKKCQSIWAEKIIRQIQKKIQGKSLGKVGFKS
jgi:hypothetical protein